MYNLIYNNEIIDTAETLDEAESLKIEYEAVYGDMVKIVKDDDYGDYDDHDYDDLYDDGEALASAGFGTDEDYGYYGDDY
jgi:Mn-dependent DtxR family transcriptional regulator